jgi:hypothetical protein
VTAPQSVAAPPELATWRRIRRYAVPSAMIAAATRARLAGDWIGACAAARVEVDVDLAAVAREFGAAAADGLAEDLAHFAPDLLRWHLPRHLSGRTGVSPYVHTVLTPTTGQTGPLLHVIPPTATTGPQALRLRVVSRAQLKTVSFYDAPRYRWDARRAPDLRVAWGGSDARPPLLNADGTAVAAPALGQGGDRAAQTERVLALMDRGETVEAWRVAGIELDPTEPEKNPYSDWSPLQMVGQPPSWPIGLADEVRRLVESYGLDEVILQPGWPARMRLTVATDGRVRGQLISYRRSERGLPYVPASAWRRPADLDLLRRGWLAPGDLHPLVHGSLFPGLAPPAPALGGIAAPEPVRVRCRGVWHRVQVTGGHISLPEHDAEEEERERTLRALGGASTGCFAAKQAWRTGKVRLPRALRHQRQDVVERIFHGDTAFVVAMLDAGHLDPWMRDGRGWTLLHMLLYLDPEPLLPRLLAAGLPIDVREDHGRTPLHVAVGNDGSVALARALFEAGADPTAADEYEGSIQEMLEYKENPDLEFLRVDS